MKPRVVQGSHQLVPWHPDCVGSHSLQPNPFNEFFAKRGAALACSGTHATNCAPLLVFQCHCLKRNLANNACCMLKMLVLFTYPAKGSREPLLKPDGCIDSEPMGSDIRRAWDSRGAVDKHEPPLCDVLQCVACVLLADIQRLILNLKH